MKFDPMQLGSEGKKGWSHADDEGYYDAPDDWEKNKGCRVAKNRPAPSGKGSQGMQPYSASFASRHFEQDKWPIGYGDVDMKGTGKRWGPQKAQPKGSHSKGSHPKVPQPSQQPFLHGEGHEKGKFISPEMGGWHNSGAEAVPMRGARRCDGKGKGDGKGPQAPHHVGAPYPDSRDEG